jgi:triacylglycerol lipase
MAYSLYEDAFGDYRNACTLAQAADISYVAEEVAKKHFQEQLDMQSQLISADNTQAYVAVNEDHVLVAFRGTESPTSIEGLKDWLLTDALNLLMVPEGRLGTDLAAAGVGARLTNLDRPLWITGHSLGGALALLAAWLFHRKMISVHQIYTFGGPMIGNADAAKAINREFKGKVFRYVNVPDPVPRLPMMSLIANQYSHCDQEMKVSEKGQDPATLVAQNTGTAEAAMDRSVIEEMWGNIQKRVAAHGMASYRKLVEALLS